MNHDAIFNNSYRYAVPSYHRKSNQSIDNILENCTVDIDDFIDKTPTPVRPQTQKSSPQQSINCQLIESKVFPNSDMWGSILAQKIKVDGVRYRLDLHRKSMEKYTIKTWEASDDERYMKMIREDAIISDELKREIENLEGLYLIYQQVC